MKTHATTFGKTPDGRRVDIFTLSNGVISAKVTSYGAALTELHAPDRAGKTADVVLGFADLAGYLGKHPYMGVTVGRVANRIGNAEYHWQGTTYKLYANNNGNTLHGGKEGFDRRVWDAQIADDAEGPAVIFTYVSPRMEEGFPGTLHTRVTYRITKDNSLAIEFYARTDETTPVNLTNHSYFNLKGAGSGDILDHSIFINSSLYTPADDKLICTGEIRSVHGTPLDFTTPHRIGERIAQVPGGYDHNFVLRTEKTPLRLAARLTEPTTGRVMEVLTTQPGIQLYTGNFLDGSAVGIGGPYGKHAGLCLETQHLPNSVHHQHFPNVMLHPGEDYRHAAIYRLSVATA